MARLKQDIPEIRFEGFSGEWEVKSFEELTKLSQGLQIAIDKRFLKPAENRVFYITNEFLNPKTNNAYYIENAPSSVIAHQDDILMTRTGNTGKVVTNIYGAFHNNFFKIKYKKNETNQWYLYFLLNSEYIQSEILKRAGSSTIPDLNHRDFYTIKAAHPSIEEQTQIGIFFQQLDKLIELQTRAVEVAERHKKAMLQKLFPQKGEKVPRIRFAGFSGDWKKYKLEELGDIVTGSTPSTSNQANYSNDGLLWVTPSDINSLITDSTVRKLSEEGQKIARIVPANSILVTCIASIGKNTLVPIKASFNQQINALIPNEAEFEVYFLLTNSLFWSQTMKNYASSGMMQLVNKTDFSLIETLIPCLEEQTAIGNFFQKLDEKIGSETKKLEQYQLMKRAMLQRMFV